MNHWATLVKSLSTQGYAIVPDCFDPQLIADLRADCLAMSEQFVPAHIGHAKKQLNSEIRSDMTHWLEAPFSPAQQSFLDEMEQLRQAINHHTYLGLFDYEVHFAHYPKGSFYRKHLDQFRNNTLRQVTTLCYLNEAWQNHEGGELCLYAPDLDKIIHSIRPQANTFVCFMSDQFPHEVLPATRSRFSLSGWFRLRA